MRQKLFNIFISFVIGILIILQIHSYFKENKPSEIKVVIIKEKQLDFFNKSPQEGLKEALEYYNIKHPNIIYAQAILETGHFKSNLCINNNNLFGLYDSKNKKYYTFDHWKDCIIAYKEMVQYKYKDGDDYYKFLSDIGYAEDTKYIDKLKEIVKQNDKRGNK